MQFRITIAVALTLCTSAFAAPLKRRGMADVYYQCNHDFSYTWDDGPYSWTSDIVDAFDAHEAKTTFYVNGDNWSCIYSEENVARLRKAYESGHQIASHTWSHPWLTTLTNAQIDEEIQRLDEALVKILGVRPKILRPPYGDMNEAVAEYIQTTHGKTIVMWDLDSGDTAAGADTQGSIDFYQELADEGPGFPHLTLSHDVWQHSVLAMASTLPALRNANINLITTAACLDMDAYEYVGSYGVRDETWTCEAPAETTPPAEETPVETPPTEETPVETPPTEETPVETPPTEETPVETPPTEETPVETPPTEETPVETPPTEETPVETPPTEETPVETPPAEETPVETPPPEDTPVETPPAEDTPVETPPPEDTPVETPPAEDTPVETPPAEDTPVETPPPEDTPVETPPAEDTPTETTPPSEPPQTTPAPTCVSTHTAGKGETCASIGNNYGLSADAIHAANTFLNCNDIWEWTPICIPPGGAACVQTYTAVAGDTCASIGSRFGLSGDAILAANNFLNCNDIWAWTPICIPPGGNGGNFAIPVPPTSSAPIVDDFACAMTYRSGRDDTCVTIGAIFGLTAGQIHNANSFVNCDDIWENTTFCIPPRGNTCKSGVTVPSGASTTCAAISSVIGVPVETIKSLNRFLNCDDVWGGTQLCLEY